MKILALSILCAFAPAAAQLGLSLPPALQSIADAVNSLTAPSDTPKPAPAPAPTPTPKAKPTPKPIGAPPVQTSSSASPTTRTTPTFTTSISTSTASKTSETSLTTSTRSISTKSSTTNTLAEAAATPTQTAASDKSQGLSHSAKVGIGVGIGVFILVGLLAAALYSFVRDRHSSEAYASWRERRAKKHSRLDSSSSPGFTTIGAFFPRREKEMELSQVEYGNGTILGGGNPVVHDKPDMYDMAESSKSTQSVATNKDLPAPPVVPQQAKEVQIKRKAVPRKPVPARKSLFKPRFSWGD